jgi:hypothetical protein
MNTTHIALMVLVAIVIFTYFNSSESFRGGGGGGGGGRGGGGRGGGFGGGRMGGGRMGGGRMGGGRGGGGRRGRGGRGRHGGRYYNPGWYGIGGAYAWPYAYYWDWPYDYPIYTVNDISTYAGPQWCWSQVTKSQAGLAPTATREDWIRWAKAQGMTVILFVKDKLIKDEYILVQGTTNCYLPSSADLSLYEFRSLM